MSAVTPAQRIEEKLHRVVDLFGAVCAAPDDPETARAADWALWELDDEVARAGQ